MKMKIKKKCILILILSFFVITSSSFAYSSDYNNYDNSDNYHNSDNYNDYNIQENKEGYNNSQDYNLKDSEGYNIPENSNNKFNNILSFFLRKTELFNNFFLSLFNLKNIKKENEQLVLENNNLKFLLEKYSEIEKENQSLKNALNIEDKEEYNFIPSNVISRSPLNFYQNFTIDKGKKQNIQLGDMVVWNGNVLVGEIKEIKEKTALVRAINDKEFRVAVFVGEKKIEAVLKGGGLELPVLEMLPSNAQIKKGDKIFTSGLDEKFIKGFLIGEIKEIEDYQDKMFQKARVELFSHWNNLIQVLILKKN
jgi:rod shape-determining protein MreC